MAALSLIIALLLQAPASLSVVVGMRDGQKLVLDNPQFSGFIETREAGSVLLYRQRDFHGELLLNAIQRINFNYKKGKPYALAVTLKSGQKLSVQSDKRDFVMLKGASEAGFITIKNPDPISPPTRLSTHAANRKHDLTIDYLEFPQ